MLQTSNIDIKETQRDDNYNTVESRVTELVNCACPIEDISIYSRSCAPVQIVLFQNYLFTFRRMLSSLRHITILNIFRFQ